MPTPEQLRADAELLRGVARTIRTKAAALADDVVAVQSHYPQKSGGVWTRLVQSRNLFTKPLGENRFTQASIRIM